MFDLLGFVSLVLIEVKLLLRELRELAGMIEFLKIRLYVGRSGFTKS